MAEIDEDYRSADLLDVFAKAGANAQVPATVPATGVWSGGAGERVIGAQKIAVPRNETEILQKLKVLAAAAGDAWYYRWPVKNKKTREIDWVEGGTIGLANDLTRTFGNCEVETRVTDLGDSWLIYARFTDYESGYSLTRPFQQRKNQKTMGDDVDRQRDMAFQIGASKAIRNVVLNALGTFADFAFKEAKKSLVNNIGEDLLTWRVKTVTRLGELNIDVKRVEAVIGRTAADWLAPDIARIVAVMRAVHDGFSTVDESFPPLAAAAPAPGATLDQFATDSGAPAPTTETPLSAAGPGGSAPEETAEGDKSPSSPSAAKSPEGRQ
jgi:hypothetical protein